MVEPFTSAATAVTAVALKPIVESIVGSLKLTVQAATKKAWEAINADDIELEYRKNVIRELGRTKILGKSHEIDIDQVYTDVRVSIRPIHESYLELEDDNTATDVAFQQLLARAKADRHKVDEFLSSETRLYVLGTPGAGKTTLMRHIAIQAARGVVARLPIYVPLRDLVAKQMGVRAYMNDIMNIGGIPEPDKLIDKLLEAGSAMLLFDGLDELPQANNFRQRLLQEMLEIARQYPKSQTIISCRTAASDRSLEHFKYLYIAEFSEEQQDRFLERWFAPDTDRLSSFRTQWVKDSNKRIRDLAASPLLLTLVCLAYNSTGAFPRKKIDLFRDALDALVYHWDTDRGIAREGVIADLLEPRRKDHLFQSMAFHTFIDDRYAFSEVQAVRELQRYFDTLPSSFSIRPTASTGMLREIAANHGIIVERAVRWYSFSHLSIHEYLVARYLNESANSDEIDITLTQHRLMDPRWREVILTLVTMRADAGREMAKMLDALAAYCKLDSVLSHVIGKIADASNQATGLSECVALVGINLGAGKRRALGRGENYPKDEIEQKLAEISARLKGLGATEQTKAMHRVRIFKHILEHYNVEFFDHIKGRSTDSLAGAGTDIALRFVKYVQFTAFFLECLKEASLKRAASDYYDSVIL